MPFLKSSLKRAGLCGRLEEEKEKTYIFFKSNGLTVKRRWRLRWWAQTNRLVPAKTLQLRHKYNATGVMSALCSKCWWGLVRQDTRRKDVIISVLFIMQCMTDPMSASVSCIYGCHHYIFPICFLCHVIPRYLLNACCASKPPYRWRGLSRGRVVKGSDKWSDLEDLWYTAGSHIRIHSAAVRQMLSFSLTVYHADTQAHNNIQSPASASWCQIRAGSLPSLTNHTKLIEHGAQGNAAPFGVQAWCSLYNSFPCCVPVKLWQSASTSLPPLLP